MHTYIYMHTYKHTYIHTYIHTYTCTPTHLQHCEKFCLGHVNTVSVGTVHHIDDCICVAVVAPPVGPAINQSETNPTNEVHFHHWSENSIPDACLPAQVPYCGAFVQVKNKRALGNRVMNQPWNLMFLYVTDSTLNPMAAK
jgi:hypothetical protein